MPKYSILYDNIHDKRNRHDCSTTTLIDASTGKRWVAQSKEEARAEIKYHKYDRDRGFSKCWRMREVTE